MLNNLFVSSVGMKGIPVPNILSINRYSHIYSILKANIDVFWLVNTFSTGYDSIFVSIIDVRKYINHMLHQCAFFDATN